MPYLRPSSTKAVQYLGRGGKLGSVNAEVVPKMVSCAVVVVGDRCIGVGKSKWWLSGKISRQTRGNEA